MSQRWPERPLSEVVWLRRGFDLPEAVRIPGKYPVIGSSGISGWHAQYKSKGPGVTIGRSGASIGEATYWPGDYWLLNTTLFVEDFLNNDPRYTYHLFKSLDLTSFNSGSAQPSLNRNYISKLLVPVAPRAEQEKISDLLGALDDKIAVNERIAATALELAGAHYAGAAKEWRDPRSVPLGEAARWLSGGTPETSEPKYWNGEVPWISASSLHSPWIDDSPRKLTSIGVQSGTRVVPAETIIFIVRGMSLRREFRIGITRRKVAFGQDCKALIANKGIDPYFLFYSIRGETDEILKMVDEAGHGTGRLQSDRLARLTISIPDSQEQEGIVARLRPLSELSAARQREARVLTELRDTLLPKLISGELRIKDAEKVVEKAV